MGLYHLTTNNCRHYTYTALYEVVKMCDAKHDEGLRTIDINWENVDKFEEKLKSQTESQVGLAYTAFRALIRKHFK